MTSISERLAFPWRYLRPHRARYLTGIYGLLARDSIAFVNPLLIRKAVTVLTDGYDVRLSADRVFRLLDTPIAKPDSGSAETSSLHPGIEFDRVWFAYQGENWVLKDVSFRVEPRQSLAVVGHTGAGKTTIINLLLRFYEQQRGTIRVGGVDIREIAATRLRKEFGVVLQDTYVHQGKILENIHFGMEEGGEDAARSAAGYLNFEDLAGSLPDGLDTHIAERGSNLSSGQKQLVGFARALCRDPKLLILDEATSDIDVETKAKIQRSLEELLEGRTSLIIAHRLTTVLRAHRILVMHKGRTREIGTHWELLARRRLYWRLYQLQFGAPLAQTTTSIVWGSAS